MSYYIYLIFFFRIFDCMPTKYMACSRYVERFIRTSVVFHRDQYCQQLSSCYIVVIFQKHIRSSWLHVLTILYATKRSRAPVRVRPQFALITVDEWLRLWKIVIIPEKSKAIPFSIIFNTYKKKFVLYSANSFHANEKLNNWVSTYKIRIKIVAGKVKFVMSRLALLTRTSCKMSLKQKLLLYKTCVHPIVSYISISEAHFK